MRTRYFFLALALTAAVLALSCKKDNSRDGRGTAPGKKGEPIVNVNGRVRFYAAIAGSNAVTEKISPAEDLTGCSLLINGKEHPLLKDSNGDFFAETSVSRDNVYNAVLLGKNSGLWYDKSALEDVAVPFSQFCTSTTEALKTYPRFASYSESTGNLLCFEDGLAVLELRISGSGVISSVKVRAVGGELTAGEAAYNFQEKRLSVSTGLDHTVVNCTEGEGLSLTASGVGVPIYLAPGNYSEGLEVTVCSMDHRMMKRNIPAFSIAAGEIRTEEMFWSAASDLLWYEGFDNFVWGGDIMGGEGTVGYAPDASPIGIAGGLAREGYAQALSRVGYDTPGMGYVQSSSWLDIKGMTVGTSHVSKNSYVASRNLADWDYLFRAQEYHGVLAVGTATRSGRGIIQFPACKSLKGMSDVRLTFKLCFQPGVTDDLFVQVIKAGHISAVKVDGRAMPLVAGYYLDTGSGTIASNKVSIPSSLAEPKAWHEVEVTVTGVTDETRLQLSGASSEEGVHGFYVDDLAVRTISGTAKKGNLRLMYMNIQNGMWSDQGKNYDNFVAWVKRYDPDICVWCEAQSIYVTGTDTYLSSSNRYLPDGWPELARRYGHSNTSLGKHRDGYPQAITSKYPITRLQAIGGPGDLPVAHGAGHFKITVKGRDINIVTCHLWPNKDKSLKPSVYPTGDEYREYEMGYLIGQTVNNPYYSSVTDWIFLGDFNAVSRLDNGIYEYPEDDKCFLAQDVVLTKTGLKDIIATWYPSPQFVQSTHGVDRRDMIYISPSLVQNVVRASTFTDSFTPGTRTGISNFSTPSDHRPFIIDFNL